MTRVINSTELHRRTSEMIQQLREDGEAVIVKTYGRPVAVLLPYHAYLAFKEKGKLRYDYPFPPTTLDEVAGSLASGGRLVMVEEMDEGVRQGTESSYSLSNSNTASFA